MKKILIMITVILVIVALNCTYPCKVTMTNGTVIYGNECRWISDELFRVDNARIPLYNVAYYEYLDEKGENCEQ